MNDAAVDQLREANWGRMREALTRAATQYQRAADELEQISFVSTAGVRRSPDAIISQAALTGDVGRDYAELMHRLATWAESINDLELHAARPTQTCGYAIDDPETTCVLTAGHTLPLDGGLIVHMSADGVKFA